MGKFIAEVKPRSPFGYISSFTKDQLLDIAIEFGEIVSIHTDSRWGGSFEWLKEVRSRTNKPILAKGIHQTDDEVLKAFECGANYVLMVGRKPVSARLDSFISSIWVEPQTLSEISDISPEIDVLVWNSRDLTNGDLKKETIQDAKLL